MDFSILIGVSVFIIMLLITQEPPSLLEKRFAKTTPKKENSLAKIIENLQEALRPVSQKNVKSAEYISKTKKLLLQAGYASSEEDVIKFDTQRIVYSIFGTVFGLVFFLLTLDPIALIVCVVAIYFAYKMPEFKLNREIKKRKKEFMKYLPDAVDLLTICVQAGLGLDASFQRVAEEFTLTSEILSSEFGRLNKDIVSGLNREDAYKNLILRNDNPDLQSFVALLIQSDRLGTSVTQSLDAFCDSMRTKRKQRIEELSQQASTKMTIPMIVFMLPAIFIIIMYPAMQKIMSTLGK